jgi:hypothetical protein
MIRFLGNVRQNGYVVQDMDAALEHWTEVLGSSWPGDAAHVVLDTHIPRRLRPHELSDISGPKGEFFEHIRRAAVDWDGTNPIRPVRRA